MGSRLDHRWQPLAKTVLCGTVLLMALGLGTSKVAADEFYRWVDDNGVTHYGKQPPPQGTAATIHVEPQRQTGARLASPDQVQRARERPEQPRSTPQQREADARNRREQLHQERRCARWQRQLAEVEVFLEDAYNSRDSRRAENLKTLLARECR